MHEDQLPLAFRCDRRWEDLGPGDGSRRCDRCHRDVVDLSSRTELAARALLATSSPCVRYRVGRDGRIRFRPSALARLFAAALAAVAPAARAAPVHVCSSVPGEVDWFTQTVEAAPSSDLGALVLELRDESDLPIAGVTVTVTSDGGSWTEALTNDAGSSLFADLAPGTYQVRLVREDFQGVTITGVEVARGSRTVDTVRLTPTAFAVMGAVVSPRWRLPRLRLRRPEMDGEAVVHVATGGDAFDRAALRCEGVRPARADLVDGQALFEQVPDDASCEVRLRGGERPLRVELVGGDSHIEVDDP